MSGMPSIIFIFAPTLWPESCAAGAALGLVAFAAGCGWQRRRPTLCRAPPSRNDAAANAFSHCSVLTTNTGIANLFASLLDRLFDENIEGILLNKVDRAKACESAIAAASS